MPDSTAGFSLPDDERGRDRLAELGQLAGSLVHELKNPLGVILLNTELLLAQLPPELTDERARKRLKRVFDSSRNLQAIIQSFLAFARPERPDREAVDVNELLAQILDEWEEDLEKAKIKVAFHPDDSLAYMPADRQQMRSIFVNVISNARDALIERADDRRLLVWTRSSHGQVRVVIANNGPPLPADVAAHLGEPFRSGKESGTGLGLAIVYRLVGLHHGRIDVANNPDQGVSFTFEFPTPLGPAGHRTQLPMPSVEAVVRASEPPAAAARRAKKPTPSRKRRTRQT
ncbi:MAG: HAMP domain-containing histidine kinase [Planctomycetes bacterium]|nr:HAMP domain-containing histidine kinase [Planctomycetota bacterium]